MGDVIGLPAFGLLFAVPAWSVWNERASAAFVRLAALAALWPDVDLCCSGPLSHRLFPPRYTTTASRTPSRSPSSPASSSARSSPCRPGATVESETNVGRPGPFAFLTAAFPLDSLCHPAVNMLSAPDGGEPIEPLRPRQALVDAVRYDAPWIDFGFLDPVIAVHVALAYP